MHDWAGINRRNCPQAFSSRKLSSNRRELRKSMIPEEVSRGKSSNSYPGIRGPAQCYSLFPGPKSGLIDVTCCSLHAHITAISSNGKPAPIIEESRASHRVPEACSPAPYRRLAYNSLLHSFIFDSTNIYSPFGTDRHERDL